MPDWTSRDFYQMMPFPRFPIPPVEIAEFSSSKNCTIAPATHGHQARKLARKFFNLATKSAKTHTFRPPRSQRGGALWASEDPRRDPCQRHSWPVPEGVQLYTQQLSYHSPSGRSGLLLQAELPRTPSPGLSRRYPESRDFLYYKVMFGPHVVSVSSLTAWFIHFLEYEELWARRTS